MNYLQALGLTQDERRAIFEERSRHTATGLKYLPSISRRLHHCRDLEQPEPFDFLTLFDYSEADSVAFEDLVAALRATEEWKYVDREVDIRLVRRQEDFNNPQRQKESDQIQGLNI